MRRELGRDPLFLETSRPGVFAAGDVRSGSIKRMASAVGEGSMAVRLVQEHLEGQGRLDRPAHLGRANHLDPP
jgi:thioredoxin reductase (NADPH)